MGTEMVESYRVFVHTCKFVIIPSLLFVFSIAFPSSLAAQDFRVTGIATNAQGKIVVTHPSETISYFILRRGTLPTNVNLAVDMRLGQSGSGQLVDSTNVSVSARSFFRVQQVPVNQPADTDGDGIDDVFELRNPPVLNGLNPADALADGDGDGINSLNEYQRGTSPTNSASANVTLFSNFTAGNNAFDGLSPTFVSGLRGPKKNIQSAIAASFSGDTIDAAAGNYVETLFSPGSKSITLRPQGTVTIQ